MEIFLLCELIGVFLVTLYLLNHYAAKDVSKPLKIFVFIPWFICFLMIGLAPIDIYYSYTTNGDELNTGFFSAPELLQNTWKALYWSSFVLSWVAIPLVQEYVNAGDFTHGDRIKRSLKINLIFYGVMGVLGLLFILYLVLSRKMGEDAILQFFITFSYCFGVFLIIVCLGFGLVHIPKRFLTKTSKPANLKYYQFKIAECREERISVKSKLDDLLKLVYLLSIRKDVDESQEAILNGILGHASEGLVLDAKGNITSVDHTKANEYDLTKDKMVALNKDVKRKIRELTRIEYRYQRTLEKAFLAEDVLESTSAEDWYERRSPDGPVLRSFGKFLNWNRYVWNTKLSSAFTLLAGVFCGAFSIFIFMVEIMSFVNANLVALNNAVGYNFMGTQVVCLIPLIYLAFCVYSSLFNMKLAGLYGLYPQQSDSGSLVFASLNFSRVAAPIVFNFLQIIKLTKTNFQIAMGDASIVISFAKYFPLLLLLLILAQLFDVYGRIMRWLGLTNFNFSDEYNEEKTEEGGLILVQARREKFGDLRERSPSKLMNSPDSPDNLRTKLLENSYDSETGLRRSSTVGGRSRLQTASQSNERLSRRSTGNWDTYTL